MRPRSAHARRTRSPLSARGSACRRTSTPVAAGRLSGRLSRSRRRSGLGRGSRHPTFRNVLRPPRSPLCLLLPPPERHRVQREYRIAGVLNTTAAVAGLLWSRRSESNRGFHHCESPQTVPAMSPQPPHGPTQCHNLHCFAWACWQDCWQGRGQCRTCGSTRRPATGATGSPPERSAGSPASCPPLGGLALHREAQGATQSARGRHARQQGAEALEVLPRGVLVLPGEVPRVRARRS